ncbi:ABC-type uncharacterized transport system, permease component [Saccharomonospora marina XMU15]|uniref:ABC-type uncharacterized transport system, permease component n=1 Tax=Saccharomonospora marina XMU15 TaxID=882083 RepID=H5X6Y5_9PSEU|nr:ABC-2 family transporter protein [Saccharomonospora marina]EHR52415.1 ABC-type uncharacterized transport system, permease component [Saccharomonospora marina XMU15]
MVLLRLIGVHLRVSVLTELQYRANFFFSIAQSCMAVGTGLVVLSLVFSRIHRINGWSEPELLVVLGVFTMLGGVVKMVIRPAIRRYIDDVRDGTLDHILLKPADSQLLVGVRAVELWQGVDIITSVVLLTVGLSGVPRPITLAGVVLFGVSVLLSLVVVYCVLVMCGLTVFWLVQPQKILDVFDGLWSAGRWPVGIYPGWLRIGMTLLVPIGFAVTVPAEALLSRMAAGAFLWLLVMSCALLAFTRWLWGFCMRRYTGASA